MDQNSRTAAEAIAFIEQSRVRLAAAAEVPPSRHAAFAALMGVWVASPALPLPFRFVVIVGIVAAMIWIIRWDRRRMGMFINGYRAGKTRRVTGLLLLAIMPLYVAGVWLTLERQIAWAPLPLALVAAGLAYAGSVWWCRVFRREMLGSIA